MPQTKKKQTLADKRLRLNIATENIIACGDGANDLPMRQEHAGTGMPGKRSRLYGKKSTSSD